MAWKPISKCPQMLRVQPNLSDYETARTKFCWDEVRRELDGLPNGKGLNIAHEAIDRHANGPERDHLAMRWLLRQQYRDMYHDFSGEESNRFANVLRDLGMGQGDRVAVLAGRIPELYLAAYGASKIPASFARSSRLLARASLSAAQPRRSQNPGHNGETVQTESR